jgi:predicted acylesterase/phospholipase RssA
MGLSHRRRSMDGVACRGCLFVFSPIFSDSEISVGKAIKCPPRFEICFHCVYFGPLTVSRAVAGLKHTNLLLHRHVIESLPQAKCALLEYITSQIEHFSGAYQLSNEVTGDIFRTTAVAAFQAGDQEEVWENFHTFVNLHDKVFRAKFHPLANSLTVPPAISLAQIAETCMPVSPPCSPGLEGKGTETSDSTRSTGKKLAILALDGGGMRGLIEIKILSALATKLYGDCDENGTKKLLANFDMIAGTSTGGIIALALQKMSLSKVREFYLSMGRQIFKSSYLYGIGRWLRYYQSGDYYSGQTLSSLFKTEFGETRLSDLFAYSTVPSQKLFLAATNATNAVWEPFVLRSYLNPKSIIPGAANVTTPDALRATSAAPTYFAAVELQVELQDNTRTDVGYKQGKVQLVDGGMTANNPTELAIFEAHHLSDSQVALIVSVGTGMPGTQPGSVNVFKMLNELIDICTSSNAIHMRVLEWIEMMPAPKPAYFRFNPSNGEGSYALDECDDSVLASLESSTERYMSDPAVLEMISDLQLALQQLGN